MQGHRTFSRALWAGGTLSRWQGQVVGSDRKDASLASERLGRYDGKVVNICLPERDTLLDLWNGKCPNPTKL